MQYWGLCLDCVARTAANADTDHTEGRSNTHQLDQVRTALATALQGLPASAQRADLEANLETGAARMHALLSTALGAKRPRSAGQDGARGFRKGSGVIAARAALLLFDNS